MVHAALALQTTGKNSRDYMLVLLFLLLVNVEGKDARAERAALKRRRQKMKRLQQTSDTKASRSRRY